MYQVPEGRTRTGAGYYKEICSFRALCQRQGPLEEGVSSLLLEGFKLSLTGDYWSEA